MSDLSAIMASAFSNSPATEVAFCNDVRATQGLLGYADLDQVNASFGGGTHLGDGHTADQIGESLLALLAVVVVSPWNA